VEQIERGSPGGRGGRSRVRAGAAAGAELGQRARGGWGKWGKKERSQPAKRYFAKCKLCVAHFVLYAPRIFDT
jgi:hypothetical protein